MDRRGFLRGAAAVGLLGASGCMSGRGAPIPPAGPADRARQENGTDTPTPTATPTPTPTATPTPTPEPTPEPPSDAERYLTTAADLLFEETLWAEEHLDPYDYDRDYGPIKNEAVAIEGKIDDQLATMRAEPFAVTREDLATLETTAQQLETLIVDRLRPHFGLPDAGRSEIAGTIDGIVDQAREVRAAHLDRLSDYARLDDADKIPPRLDEYEKHVLTIDFGEFRGAREPSAITVGRRITAPGARFGMYVRPLAILGPSPPTNGVLHKPSAAEFGRGAAIGKLPRDLEWDEAISWRFQDGGYSIPGALFRYESPDAARAAFDAMLGSRWVETDGPTPEESAFAVGTLERIAWRFGDPIYGLTKRAGRYVLLVDGGDTHWEDLVVRGWTATRSLDVPLEESDSE